MSWENMLKKEIEHNEQQILRLMDVMRTYRDTNYLYMAGVDRTSKKYHVLLMDEIENTENELKIIQDELAELQKPHNLWTPEESRLEKEAYKIKDYLEQLYYLEEYNL
tara:strand:+ start:159 stop:482 length:324 start_codon:yes stop_codon:yes gene_type:complete